MTVLVTGGAGYIGSHMTLDLLAAGENVVVVDDLRSGFRDAVPGHAMFVQGDIGDAALISQVLAQHKCDAIIHFAGSTVVPESVSQPLDYYQNNSAKTLALLQAAVQAGVPNFVFSSTAAVYGTVDSKPVNETVPLCPVSPYGASKMMSERMLQDAAAAFPLQYAILRYFNVAGADPQGRAGQSTPHATHLIKVACQTALGLRSCMDIFGDKHSTKDGTGVRDYIHVSDLTAAHLLALNHLRAGRGSFIANCGYGHGFSVREVIDCVQDVAGINIDVSVTAPRPGEIASVVANSDRLKMLTQWAPKHQNLTQIVTSAYLWEQHLIEKRHNQHDEICKAAPDA
ncbi:UDP-glucose 4-epimerase GalE [Yoonia sp.]|uniref:UDP-glucose 4-epimerase GalE n=1 Tax=Yoonia sp. TaxID=2212373 RepID=UPI0025E3D6FC|nr:UDP-glucose 4-epimerase GalE [Yoonia sp.]